MLIKYNFEKIKKVFNDFYNFTGINANLVGTDFTFFDCNPLVYNKYCKMVNKLKHGNEACYLSDVKLLKECERTKKPTMHVCHAGLIDIAFPILYENIILGYVIIGQLKSDNSYEKMNKFVKENNLDLTSTESLFSQLPMVSSDKIESIINVTEILVKYIIFENLLTPMNNKTVNDVLAFINQNIDKPLDVKSISKKTGVSTSVIYRNFQRYLGCTISKYINNQRIEKAVTLLTTTDLSIKEISTKVGYLDSAYFSRVFKKLKGYSPLYYKRNLNA